MAPTFTELPTEILETIFLYLDPPSLVAVSQTCHLVKKVAFDKPLIWRHFCQTLFKSWNPQHDIATKFEGPLSDIDWRNVFIRRIKIEKETLRLLNKVLEGQRHRKRHIDEIAKFGYDVKDVLLRECACDDDRHDVLARRYWANEILARVQREVAIDVWQNLSKGADVSIEVALGAYDVFTRTGDGVGFEQVTHDLDQLAKSLYQRYPEFPSMSARSKASTLASFLREEGFRGVSNSSYRALRNSFIGLVLRSETHESLPLISVAIYCALARRVGLDARPNGFLYHVYCLVYAPPNYTLNGVYKPTSSTDLDSMYLDPFRSSDEVPAAALHRTLREAGVPPSDRPSFLTFTNTREMVLRTARNIMNSVQMIRQTQADLTTISTSLLNAYPDMDNSFYATIWAMFILGQHGDTPYARARRREYLPYLLDHYQTHCPWDGALLDKYVAPLFTNSPEAHSVRGAVAVMRKLDAEPRSGIDNERTEYAANVTFKVGQIFRHKRYHYEGVITGWDVACLAEERWIQSMAIDSLSRGRHQSFYHVLVADKSLRYVAGENIVICEPGSMPSEGLLKLAGRHFKRWDAEAGAFVSNIRDDYPDD